MTKLDLTWNPGRGVGSLRLGGPIDPLVRAGILFPEEHLPEFSNFETYEDAEGRVSIDLDENRNIESIMCDVTLTYKGEELIGRSEAEILEILDSPEEIEEPEEMPSGAYRIPWWYDSLGLVVFFEEGHSVNIIVDEPFDEDDED